MKIINKAERILRQIARDHHTTVEEVRNELAAAIEIGMNNPDPEVQQKWKEISRTGKKPTVEELILYINKEAKRRVFNNK